MISARSRRLQKKLETSFRKDLRIIISQVKAGVTPSFGASVARKEREIEATVRSETRKLFNTVVEINDQKYERVFTKQVDLGFGFSRPEAVARWTNEFIQNREIIFAGISQSMTRKILDDIQELDAEGIGVDALARQINRKYSGINRRRAALIARTETHNAAGYGQHNYHKSLSSDLGVSMVKQWVATLDARTRSSHAQMNGTQVSMDEPFMMPNGREMQYVGDPDGGAANVINCRCAIVYIDADDNVEDREMPQQQPPQESEDNEFARIEVDKFGRPQNNVTQAQFAKEFSGMSAAALRDRGRRSVDRIKQRLRQAEGAYGEYHKDVSRFRGRSPDDYYKIKDLPQVTEFTEPLVPIAMERVMDELDAMADHFKIPRLRGYKTTNKANASMGDGVMAISDNMMAGMRNGLRNPSYRDNTSKWKMGDDPAYRPTTVKAFEGEAFERYRSTMYHEFAHHIHQTWGYNFAAASADNRRGYFFPKIEKILKGRRNWKKTGASNYSDYNMKEWFAENFSLWARGKDDLVAPRFKKFIEDLASGVDVDGI